MKMKDLTVATFDMLIGHRKLHAFWWDVLGNATERVQLGAGRRCFKLISDIEAGMHCDLSEISVC